MSDIPADLALAIRAMLDAREAATRAHVDAVAAALHERMDRLEAAITGFEARTASTQAALDRYLALDKYTVTRAAIADVLREASND